MARVRVEVPGLFGDAPRARRIEARLRALPGVALARASERTGRALVVAGSARGADQARAAIAAEADPAGPEAPSIRRAIGSASRSIRRAVRFVRAAARESDGAAAPEAEEAPAEPAYHALCRNEIARELGVDPAFGLDDAAVAERLLARGPNVLAGMKPRSAAATLAGQVLTVPTAILAAAAGASALLGDHLEAAAIGGVVGTNVAIGYFTERRAEELLRAWGEVRAERARVLRRGREAVIRAADVVPGDVLVLRGGEAVAADARVISEDGLSTDESTLTGESEPVEKDPDPVPASLPVADRDQHGLRGHGGRRGRRARDRHRHGRAHRARRPSAARSAPRGRGRRRSSASSTRWASGSRSSRSASAVGGRGARRRLRPAPGRGGEGARWRSASRPSPRASRRPARPRSRSRAASSRIAAS